MMYLSRMPQRDDVPTTRAAALQVLALSVNEAEHKTATSESDLACASNLNDVSFSHAH